MGGSYRRQILAHHRVQVSNNWNFDKGMRYLVKSKLGIQRPNYSLSRMLK